MINKREYKTPLAEITKFECADVITASQQLSDKPTSSVSGKQYIKVGNPVSWNESFGKN